MGSVFQKKVLVETHILNEKYPARTYLVQL